MEQFNYYYLKKGEIIKEGDEVEISNYKDPAKWVPGNANNVGSAAPDPQFPSHRKYRRPKWTAMLDDPDNDSDDVYDPNDPPHGGGAM